jgi:hypothetical protein
MLAASGVMYISDTRYIMVSGVWANPNSSYIQATGLDSETRAPLSISTPSVMDIYDIVIGGGSAGNSNNTGLSETQIRSIIESYGYVKGGVV